MIRILLILIGVATSGASAGQTLNVVTWGGAVAAAHRQALFDTFARKHDIAVNSFEYVGVLRPLRKQISGGSIEWDVVAVNQSGLDEGCRDALFAQIDHERFSGGFDGTPAGEDFFSMAAHPCAVGASIRSLMFFYDPGALTLAPAQLSDMFDPVRFPGKRALPRTPRGPLEWALIGDGVPPGRVYEELDAPGGAARAFARLADLSEHVVWWRTLDQPGRMLRDGEVAFAAGPHDAIAPLVATGEGAPLWSGHLWEVDYWAIVKGTPRVAAATAFVQFATDTLQQVEVARLLLHGPTRRSALLYTQAEVQAWLPSADDRLLRGTRLDHDWWQRHGADLNAQFRKWWQKTRR